MRKVIIEAKEAWDPVNEMFVEIPRREFMIEHSLISISRWESKWHKPFLSTNKTVEEWIDYIKCMTLNPNIPEDTYAYLTTKDLTDIDAYTSDLMTATWFSNKEQGRRGSQKITSELIYSWMVDLGIPFECEKWHINRLLTLIRVCTVKMNAEKMSKKDLYAQNRALNMARRKRLGTKG